MTALGRWRYALVSASIGLCLLSGSATAQTMDEGGTRAVTIGLYVSPPFVMAKEGIYSGMAVDLWQAVATRLGLANRYVTYPTFRALIEATRKGEIDAAVTNLCFIRAPCPFPSSTATAISIIRA